VGGRPKVQNADGWPTSPPCGGNLGDQPEGGVNMGRDVMEGWGTEPQNAENPVLPR
jgi:hypothetical protein